MQRILGDRQEAEEVVQDVFWQLWNAQLRYDERRGKLTTWIFAVARNRAVDRLRQRASRQRVAASAETDPVVHDDLERRVCDRERQDAVQAALAGLSPGQREAIELSFYRGLTQSEIARETGEALGTVKSRMSRAMAALRETLARSEAIR